jgi:hypothetical protein
MPRCLPDHHPVRRLEPADRHLQQLSGEGGQRGRLGAVDDHPPDPGGGHGVEIEAEGMPERIGVDLALAIEPGRAQVEGAIAGLAEVGHGDVEVQLGGVISSA